jgi:hypothetical protein
MPRRPAWVLVVAVTGGSTTGLSVTYACRESPRPMINAIYSIATDGVCII